MNEHSALSLLTDGEICIVRIGLISHQCEWSTEHGCWFCSSGDGPRSFLPTEVDEWMPLQ